MDGTEQHLISEQDFRIGVLNLLVEIRDALTGATVAAEAPVGCSHPEDKRVSLATFAEPDHWICSVPTCRYEHRGVVHN